MRINAKLVATGVLTGLLGLTLGEPEAAAQTQTPPIAERDANWDVVSTVMMSISIVSASLTPRVYYSSPDATVGWKARWHASALAPIATMAALTWLIDGPIRSAIESPRDRCTVDQTTAMLPDSGCESWGSPSTHAFAAWGATGYGLVVFLVDTFKYSESEFSFPYLLGTTIVPFTAAMIGSIARSADGSGIGPEGTGQVFAGAIPGLLSGALLGLMYSFWQEPDCQYGGFIICW
jgi:hypothetical protein